MNILHIIPDDKFWLTIKTIFDRTTVQNEYVCIVNSTGKETRYVDSRVISVFSQNEACALWCRNDVDVFVFHSIPYSYYDYILSIDKEKIVIVVSWGYDIYFSQMGCPPIIPLRLFKSGTAHLLKTIEKTSISRSKTRSFFKYLFNKDYRVQKQISRRHINEWSARQKEVLDRIDYWSTILPIEFEMLKKRVRIQAQYFPLHYTNRLLTDDIPTINPEMATDLMIGNSADPANNHIDIVRLLNRRGINNRLFIPLAYGVNDYRDALIRFVESQTHDVVFQLSFIPVNEYKKNLLNCKAAVFGHIRQQSIGNIVICMLQGIKVFLYKNSVAYKFFKSQGSFVFSIEDDLFPDEILKPLTREQNELNRKKLDWLSLDYVVPEVERALEEIGRGRIHTS